MKAPAKKGRKTGKPAKGAPSRVKACHVRPSNDPCALLRACGVSRVDFSRFMIELGQQWYPGLGKLPGMRLYDGNRPAGWPGSESLCRAFKKRTTNAGWNEFLLAACGVGCATQSEAHRYAWVRRKAENPIDKLSDSERFACQRRGGVEERTRRRPECVHATNRESYRLNRMGAVLQWRPLMEWGLLPDGAWGYVKIGEYSVWLLI